MVASSEKTEEAARISKKAKAKNKKVLLTSIIIALIVAGAGIVYAANLAQKQQEPQVSGFDVRFVASYVSERMTTQSAGVSVPCFAEDTLLFSTGCYSLGNDAGFHATFGFRTDLFEQIVKVYPDPLVRILDDTVYLVYDSDRQTRLFLYFSLDKSKAMFADGFPVIMKKKLAYLDFSGLRTGSNLDEVGKIDPVMPLYQKHFDSISSESIKTAEQQGRYLTSIHLLSDGILKIVYDRSGSQYLITGIQFKNNFILDGLFGKTDYRILEDDYIG